MPNDAIRSDSDRFEGDDRAHLSGDAPDFDPPQLGSSLEDELGDSPFALAFDSGGEG